MRETWIKKERNSAEHSHQFKHFQHPNHVTNSERERETHWDSFPKFNAMSLRRPNLLQKGDVMGRCRQERHSHSTLAFEGLESQRLESKLKTLHFMNEALLSKTGNWLKHVKASWMYPDAQKTPTNDRWKSLEIKGWRGQLQLFVKAKSKLSAQPAAQNGVFAKKNEPLRAPTPALCGHPPLRMAWKATMSCCDTLWCVVICCDMLWLRIYGK